MKQKNFHANTDMFGQYAKIPIGRSGDQIMLKSERQKNICRKYSARDKDGYVHCNDCPLVVDRKYHMCRSNSHYDRRLKEWVPDEVRDK